ncbi:hypothetical protein [Metabacillus sp. RGM 3146]|uniref:hypothetical protein n=1 Tax=Metabacillus sp. RGM 3146 TaxID=3401092 RepID=UPI003B9AFB52
MQQYVIDFILVSGLVIGFTAMMGVFANGISQTLFKGKKQTQSFDHSQKVQAGWNKVKR